VQALERAAQGLTCTTAVHICYGYGIEANIAWKKTLGDQWRQYEKVFPGAGRQPHRPGQPGMHPLARCRPS
jgi:5-methyltetrahydropteroyltriglutamate--homocysteine methyltransferase